MPAPDREELTGIVLKHQPVGDYDYSVTLLTLESGKRSAFARGARRIGTKLCGAVEPFCFGQFVLTSGRQNDLITQVRIDQYFEGFREDLNGALYGSYLLELADYYAREYNEDAELLRLLYQSLRALLSPALDDRLVRMIYEFRLFMIEGEFAGAAAGGYELSEAASYALDFIQRTPIERLYTFRLSGPVLEELVSLAGETRRRLVDRRLKSLELLERMSDAC